MFFTLSAELCHKQPLKRYLIVVLQTQLGRPKLKVEPRLKDSSVEFSKILV